MTTQRGQFTSQLHDAGVSRRGVHRGRARIADGVRQACGVGVGGGFRDDPVGRGAVHRQCGVVEFDRSSPQRRDVTSAQPPARPGEHPHGGGARGGVGHQSQRRHHVGDLWHAEQPGEADDLDRDTSCGQRVGHRCGVGVAAHEHGGGGCGRALTARIVIDLRQLICHPITFGHNVVQQRTSDGARRRIGLGPQLPNRH